MSKEPHVRVPPPAGGYSTILDANGVSTLRDSYDHLAPTGRLVVFGFHSNLPMGRAALSPLQWIGMGRRMSAMPSFTPPMTTAPMSYAPPMPTKEPSPVPQSPVPRSQ